MNNEEEEKPRTRCGYEPQESLRALESSLGQAGAVSTGRALHFAADIVKLEKIVAEKMK